MYFSKNLVFLRKLKGYTQSEIAVALNLSRTTYANYEAGQTEPDYSRLLKIAQVLDISIDDLLRKDMADVHLIPGNQQERETGKSTPISTPISTPNPENLAKNNKKGEGQLKPGEREDLIFNYILTEIRTITKDVAEIKYRLDKGGL